MFLEKPAFSTVVSLADAEKKVSSLLKKMHWKEFSFLSAEHEVSTTHSHGVLFLVPYWFFSYDVSDESSGKTKLVASGSGALNSFSNYSEPSMARLIKIEDAKKTNLVDEKLLVNVLPSRTSEAEAMETLKVRLASSNSTSKGHVIVSGLELLFVPVWLIEVGLGKNTASIRVNAVSGEILNKDAVPEREKGFAELTREMLSELSTPQGWVEYSKAVMKTISGQVSAQNNFRQKHSETDLQSAFRELSGEDSRVILLAMAAIAVILLVFYAL